MTIPAPPVGARVRHTTTYSQGTTVTIDGTVVLDTSPNQIAEPRIYIGDDADQLVAYLVDRPGEYTVALEVLAPPPPTEPEEGFVGRAGDMLWERDDRPERDGDVTPGEHWWTTGNENAFTWAELRVRLRELGHQLTRLIPDPADDAPALPWSGSGPASYRPHIHIDGDQPGRLCISVPDDDYSPDEAETIASVIWRAAREARQQ